MPGGPHPGCPAVEGFRLPGTRPSHREICQIHWRFLPLQARQSGGAGRIRSPRPSRKSVLTARPEPPKRGAGANTAAVKPRPNCITQQTCNFFTRRKAFLQKRSAYWPATDSAEPGSFLLPPSQIPSPGTPPRHRHFSSRGPQLRRLRALFVAGSQRPHPSNSSILMTDERWPDVAR